MKDQKDNKPKTFRNLKIYLDKLGFEKVKWPEAEPDKSPKSFTDLIIEYELSSFWLQKLVKRWKERLTKENGEENTEAVEKWQKEWEKFKKLKQKEKANA